MSNAFILLMEEYPGVTILGVYSSLENARTAKKTYTSLEDSGFLYKDAWIEEWNPNEDPTSEICQAPVEEYR